MFITNDREKNLEKRLKELIERSQELKFLVAFFYFSGVDVLYQTLKKLYEDGKLKEGFMKVLVGLKVDKHSYEIYESAKVEPNANIGQIKKGFIDSVVKALTSKDLDRKELYEQAEFFIKLLSEGIIQIRKTREPNHAKLYIFKMDESIRTVVPGVFITGSSNLTRAGVSLQKEFNVEIKDYGLEEAERYFDTLWESAVELSREDVIKLVKTIQEKTMLRKVEPFHAYVHLLKTYLELHQGSYPTYELEKLLEDKGYKKYDYQLSAVSQAVAMCQAHGGCILADVVGLGKTIVACLTAKALGKRGIVICPPHLKGDEEGNFGWEKYKEDFELHDWKVFSLGKLKDALDFVKERPDIEMVIVDEAHRFRNEETESYHYLREICRGKTVLLLSATPFNNRPSDIFALLKLFTVPKKSSIIYDQDLEARFKEYEKDFEAISHIKRYWNSMQEDKRIRALKEYEKLFKEEVSFLTKEHLRKVEQKAKAIAREIRSVIEPVVIRRNRLDLKYFADWEHIELPKVEDPIEAFFELTPTQLQFYDEVIRAFYPVEEGGRFKGAIYRPVVYQKKSEEESFTQLYQTNLYDLMRRLLVKRFESSFSSFEESLKNFIEVHKNALEFIRKTGKFILDRKTMEKIAEAGDDDDIIRALKEYEEKLKEGKLDSRYHKIYEVEELRGEFLEDIKSDIRLFEELLKKAKDLKLSQEDPKAKKLVEIVDEYLRKGIKVVIFTEYVDTAYHLKSILEEAFPGKVLSAIGTLSKDTVTKLYTNFDAQYKEQEDQYQVLVATDKLSEGFNLNRAGVVINYDIPWNPVRVIQRVGRINRIGKKVYDSIYIVNFFPTEKGADHVRSREIAQTKMFMIHQVLGEDAKIFSPDEEPRPSELYRRLTSVPQEEEEESFFTKVKKEFERIKKEHPDVLKEIENMPNRVKTAKRGKQDELIVFIKRGKDLFVGYYDYTQKAPVFSTFEEVFEKIKATPQDRALQTSEKFWEAYKKISNKDFYRHHRQSDNSSRNAIRVLETLLEKYMQVIEPYKDFILEIREDLKNYGSLSEYAIKEIADLERFLKKEDGLKEVIAVLDELKKQIGEGFTEKLKGAQEDEDIIIAIENRKE